MFVFPIGFRQGQIGRNLDYTLFSEFQNVLQSNPLTKNSRWNLNFTFYELMQQREIEMHKMRWLMRHLVRFHLLFL